MEDMKIVQLQQTPYVQDNPLILQITICKLLKQIVNPKYVNERVIFYSNKLFSPIYLNHMLIFYNVCIFNFVNIYFCFYLCSKPDDDVLNVESTCEVFMLFSREQYHSIVGFVNSFFGS